MAPTPQDGRVRVMISGMSGLYPEANDMMEFKDMLYKKINPIKKTDRWETQNPEAVQYVGHVSGIDAFDAQFFKVPYHIALLTDPMTRKLMEQAYQAIYDAGLTPEHMRDQKVGVYVGAGFSNSANTVLTNMKSKRGNNILGISKTMFANRISYSINQTGPSATIDGACCGSLEALTLAYNDIISGECDAAVVGGSHLCLTPYEAVHYSRITHRSKDDKTKCFDEEANGFTMSDAINVLLLQKEKDALRVYAEVVYTNTEYCGLKRSDPHPKFNFYRNPEDFCDFLMRFYENANVSPKSVEYVEAFGSASPEADKSELETIEDMFCKDRKSTLIVGSVMSNIGYTEAATGISAITKVLLGYHTGKLAGNLHCERPRQDVQALRDGRMRIATDHKEFGRSYAAVNGLSVLGTTAHVLLKGHFKPKDKNRYKTKLPYLVTISSRLDSDVNHVLKSFQSRPIDPEEIALLHNIHTKRVFGHLGRGYIILDSNKKGKTASLSEKYTFFDKGERPLWFVYSGMGSQWPGMGTALLRIPIFAAAIRRCHNVLKSKGINLVRIITSQDKAIFDNILHSFVGIAAVQIGLTDVMTALGIVPDKIIGHSVGELGCAYADGCFTAEEMILAAYSRGLVSSQTKFIRGAMAAVGLGYHQILPLLPGEIEVACHNSSTSCTISGPYEILKKFVAELSKKEIFAREVPCSEIAFHSRYIVEGGPALLKYLSEIIKDPKPRSERWVSTSIPQLKWNDPLALTSSAEYHTNNLLSPVLFEEASQQIPMNAVLVEIAPHGLLQAILKRSLNPTCVHVPLTKRGHPDSVVMLLEAIGKLFMEGYNPNVANLYPKVQFPVSTETPMLSHLVKWAHSEEKLPAYTIQHQRRAAVCKFIIIIHDDDYKYINGHIIRGKIHYPFSAILVAVWETLAMFLNKPKDQISVMFKDVDLKAQPVMQEQRALKITVAIQKGSGRFEVLNKNSVLASGIIFEKKSDYLPEQKSFENDSKDLTASDIYKLFYERGFQYQGEFRSLHKVNTSLNQSQVLWNKNWVTFLDGVIQLANLNHPYKHVSQPLRIRSLYINNAQMDNNKSLCSAFVLHRETIRCGGVLIEDIFFKDIPFLTTESIVLKPLSGSAERNCGQDKRNVTLQSGIIDDLDSLQWVETTEPTGFGVTVNVEFAVVNTVDVKRAIGEVPFEDDHINAYGMDFSGHTDNGCRVMGLVRCGSTARRVRACPELLWPVPAHWTLEDAATVPSAYMHAFYCLTVKTSLTPGMRVLVHGGAGALGQALVSVALALKAEVFTTVSDFRKKRFLLRLFPELQEDHIACSRDLSFEEMLKTEMKGGLIDLIVSCVTGELKNASLKCCKSLIDVVGIATNENYTLGLANVDNASYLRVDFKSIISSENLEVLKDLQLLLAEGIKRGFVRPLTRVTYGPEKVSSAFRLLAASNHRGRVLLQITGQNIEIESRICCSKEHAQLVVCSDECLGALWVERLIARGALNVMLHCTDQTRLYPPEDSNLFHLHRTWKKLGAEVKLSTAELKNGIDIKYLIEETNTLAPLRGIYVLANNSFNKYNINVVIKNLDRLSRKLTQPIEYFAILTDETDVGAETCISRAKHNAPITLLSFPKKTAKDEDEVNYYNNVIESLERALCSKQSALSAQSMKIGHKTLLQEITRITHLNIPNGTSDDSTLSDLGLKPESFPALSTFLCYVHNISLPEKDFGNLTVKVLRDMDKYLSDVNFKEVKGLERIFLNLETDEIKATTDAVIMPTLFNSNLSLFDGFDMTQGYMCIIPGLDGMHGKFDTLCEGLKISALVLQPGFDHPEETVEETAQRLVQCLFNKLDLKNTKKHFYLLGYEIGIFVALEMAIILEKHGLSGTVFLLGGTANSVQTALTEWAEGLDPDAWDVAESSLSKRGLSGQHRRALLLSAAASLKRTLSARTPPLPRARLVVLAATEVPNNHSPHYHCLPTPLAHLPQDLRCAAIINSYLLSEDIEAFKQRNLCENYLLNVMRYT